MRAKRWFANVVSNIGLEGARIRYNWCLFVCLPWVGRIKADVVSSFNPRRKKMIRIKNERRKYSEFTVGEQNGFEPMWDVVWGKLFARRCWLSSLQVGCLLIDILFRCRTCLRRVQSNR